MNTVIQRGHIQLIKAASKDIYSVIKYIYIAFRKYSVPLKFFLYVAAWYYNYLTYFFFLINLPHNDSENRILEMSVNLLKRKNWNITFT